MGCCGKAVQGAVGLTKAALHIDRATPEAIEQRRDICRTCEHMGKRKRKDGTMGLTTLSWCAVCSCFIGAKTLIASATCDEGKW